MLSNKNRKSKRSEIISHERWSETGLFDDTIVDDWMLLKAYYLKGTNIHTPRWLRLKAYDEFILICQEYDDPFEIFPDLSVMERMLWYYSHVN